MDKKDKEFSEAMQTKLRLNREMRSKASESQAQSSEPSEQTGGSSLRASIIEEAKKRHPNLTDETASRMLDEFGA